MEKNIGLKRKNANNNIEYIDWLLIVMVWIKNAILHQKKRKS